MHVHASQINPYAALDALRSAEKTAAKQKAALIRKKLMESASELAGESEISEAIVLDLESRRNKNKDSRPQPKRKFELSDKNRQRPNEAADAEPADRHISNWA